MNNINKDMAVIFDLDGVLVNTGEFHKQAWYDLAQKEGFQMSDELFYGTFGMQNYQIIPMLAKRDVPAEDIDRLSQWKERHYRQLVSGKLVLLDGAKSLIDDLTDNGFRLAVGTSAPQVNLTFILEHTELKGCFDACVTGEEVSNGKPAPDTFVKAAEKLSVEPCRCVVVEDSVPGVEAGKAAGMAVVAVTTTRERADLRKADLVVDSLARLKATDFQQLLKG